MEWRRQNVNSDWKSEYAAATKTLVAPLLILPCHPAVHEPRNYFIRISLPIQRSFCFVYQFADFQLFYTQNGETKVQNCVNTIRVSASFPIPCIWDEMTNCAFAALESGSPIVFSLLTVSEKRPSSTHHKSCKAPTAPTSIILWTYKPRLKREVLAIELSLSSKPVLIGFVEL